MQISDYKCLKCNKVFEFCKMKALEDFPKLVKCIHCKGNAERIYGIGDIAISEGNYGNAKTGYEKTIKGYQYSSYGRNKGLRITNN